MRQLPRSRSFLKNTEGFIYGTDRSGSFTIDNPGNGAPYLEVLGREFETGRTFEEDSVTISYLASDPEGDPLTIRIAYKVSGGAPGAADLVFPASGDSALQSTTVSLTLLPNSDMSRFVVSAYDGSLSASDSTFTFKKQTPRLSGPAATPLSGGGGKVTVQVTNPAAVTGDLYRLTFDDTLYATKTYTVENVTQNSTVLNAVPIPPAKLEGPEFDGLRLIIEDYPNPTFDPDRSRWVSGLPSLIPGSPYLPTLFVGNDVVTGYPFPFDYRVSFASGIVDTSSGVIPGFPATPVPFAVDNLTESRDAEFVFSDLDFSGTVTNFDEIYLLEEDSLGMLTLGWGISFAGSTDETLPQPGDVYELRTLKPISHRDVYEFQGMVVSVASDEIPQQAELQQNYPNPFNPSTQLRFTLTEAADVRLLVYDVLGREVARLVEGRMTAGIHTVSFDGIGLSSGVYFARFSAGDVVSIRRMVLLR